MYCLPRLAEWSFLDVTGIDSLPFITSNFRAPENLASEIFCIEANTCEEIKTEIPSLPFRHSAAGS